MQVEVRTSSGFAPTVEQEAALALFATGESMKIEAGAGTGKTSTLLLLAESAPTRNGQYVAFNRKIVDESALRFPGSVKCKTAHQLAFATHGHKHMPRIKASGRMKSADVAAFLGLKGMAVDVAGGRKWLSAGKLAGFVLKGVERFCQTADEAPTARHVPFLVGIDVPPFRDGRRNYSNNNAVAAYLAPYLTRAWADIRQVDGKLPSGHHVYLKLWQLDWPRINADYILFDEAQDASPVMVDVVSKQSCQVVWVGDSQQEIYGFTGAVNALATMETPHRTFLTKSFRFGPAVAAQANAILSMIPEAEIRLEGHDPIPSRVERLDAPGAVLCRTNAEAVRVVLGAQRAGRKPFLVGGGEDIVAFARGVKSLVEDGWTSHPDLGCFKTWDEVLEYVAEDEQGGDLRLMVKLVEEFTVETILAALSVKVKEADADVIVSTAHKAKGLEWDTVQLASDFPEDRDKAGVEELRLLYVACTRARLVLDITRVRCLTGLAPETPLSGAESPQDALDEPARPVTLPAAPAAPDGHEALIADALLRMCAEILTLGVDLSDEYAAELAVATGILDRAAAPAEAEAEAA